MKINLSKIQSSDKTVSLENGYPSGLEPLWLTLLETCNTDFEIIDERDHKDNLAMESSMISDSSMVMDEDMGEDDMFID